MSTLNDYLGQKREAITARKARIAAGDSGPKTLTAQVRAEGRSGIRRIRIRDFQVISDSEADFAGYDLGPSSPELQLGVLGSCLTHIFLIQAADRGVPLESLEVEIRGQIDPRAGRPGFEQVPIYPHDITYTVNVTSSASREEIDALQEAVERNCPILNLLKNPQQIGGEVRLTPSRAEGLAAE
ncbi:putative OsmC-like protein [Inquilinus ginsengisoli]|uniref:OsmC-like protein n=1 Tax=Inquilinus ginsengisoli TaxID=363840 RepID=A0ABU1JN30_9PROT|nr:OsmC family protein [Inquilinus ginsengisoli]MDR6290030.1 putative OsmC-like protein [Inquilinus ginsengisoli]